MLKLHKVFRLHRVLGAAAAVLVVMLVVTGLLLGHTDDLGLARRHVSSPFLLAWYGIQPAPLPRGFRAGAHWITQLGRWVYRDADKVADAGSGLIGAVALPDLLVLGEEDRLVLLDAAGRQVEILRAGEGPPAGLRRIGVRDGRLVVATDRGEVQADAELLSWGAAAPGATRWAASEPLPSELAKALTERYRGQGPSWERVLLDIHSGRILGWPGELLVDLTGAALLLLAGSGVWMWWRMRRGRRRAL